MKNLRIVLNSRRDLTPEQAHETRVRAWMFVFACHDQKESGGHNDPDDDKGSANAEGS